MKRFNLESANLSASLRSCDGHALPGWDLGTPEGHFPQKEARVPLRVKYTGKAAEMAAKILARRRWLATIGSGCGQSG
ncbi:MAG: hypothetical protein FWD68_18420 [Alphaproteobacteria bacterium]|nr:hypothetical protein [Alphaproteobacteria bacterium]